MERHPLTVENMKKAVGLLQVGIWQTEVTERIGVP